MLINVVHDTGSTVGSSVVCTKQGNVMISNKPNLFSPKALARAKKHSQKMRVKIKDAAIAGKSKLLRRRIVEYLQSAHAQAQAVLEAYNALKPSRRPGRKQLTSIVQSLNPWQPLDEQVVVSIKTKRQGQYRIVMDFGIRHRAHQYLLASVLEVIADLHPDQYLTRGGVPAAIDRVTALWKEGYRWIIEIDIKNCFPSFTGTSLEKYIPVMKEVIANVIMATHLNVVPGHALLYHFGPGSAGEDDPGDPVEFAKVLSDARQGIPQGSAVASIVVEMLLAMSLKSLPTSARVVCYADNMLIMAKSEEEAVSVTKTLWSALEAHPVGHLKPKLMSYSSPGMGFDFLGHHISPTKFSVNITPSQENENEFCRRLKKGLVALTNMAYPKSKRAEFAADLRSYVTSWTANFSRCNGMDKRRSGCLAKIDKALAFSNSAASTFPCNSPPGALAGIKLCKVSAGLVS